MEINILHFFNKLTTIIDIDKHRFRKPSQLYGEQLKILKRNSCPILTFQTPSSKEKLSVWVRVCTFVGNCVCVRVFVCVCVCVCVSDLSLSIRPDPSFSIFTSSSGPEAGS